MVFSVSEANNFIKALLDAVPQLQTIFVRGEISNYKLYPSGHHYFTLKDEGSALRCVMFRGMASKLRFRPENGMKVIAFGRIGVFPRDGAYQLYCNTLTADGAGDLYVAFEQLKEKLTILLLPRDPNDSRNVILEIRGGVGGEESALFAHSLLRMYTMYAESRGWKLEIASINETELGGVKDCSAVIALFPHLAGFSAYFLTQIVVKTVLPSMILRSTPWISPSYPGKASSKAWRVSR